MTQVEPDALIEAVQAVVRNVPGIRKVPESIPDQLAAWPAAVIYYQTGGYETGDHGISDAAHNIAVDVMMPRKDLASAMRVLTPFIKSVPAQLMQDPTFGDLCEPPARIDYELFTVTYAETEAIGYRFVMQKVKTFPYGKK